MLYVCILNCEYTLYFKNACLCIVNGLRIILDFHKKFVTNCSHHVITFFYRTSYISRINIESIVNFV